MRTKLVFNSTVVAVTVALSLVDYLATNGEYVKSLFNDPKLGGFIAGLIGAVNVGLHLYANAVKAEQQQEDQPKDPS